ncbi:MAG: anthranilate synthase component I [Veillonellaceae bacterium]|jgi:anthranilate synthase component 1|nr:anthranilate synthase component I [Veillonellaceae bacterium]
MKIRPSYPEFKAAAAQYNVIPVRDIIAADMETPITVYYKVVGQDRGFMLESAESSRNFGRYSFIGAQPFALFTGRPKAAEIIQSGVSLTVPGNPLAALEKYMKNYSAAELDKLPPFAGGAAGYFAYETVATWERNRFIKLPDDMVLAELMFCRVNIVFDHLYNTIEIIYLAEVSEGSDLELLYHQAVDQIKDIISKLQKPLSEVSDFAVKHSMSTNNYAGSKVDRDKYIAMVERAKEFIAAGDVFQVVLSQRFSREIKCQPFSIYRRLRRLNPSPYMFYFNFGRRQIIGTSPEMLVKVTDGRVETCPIAGTRPRGRTSTEDSLLAEQLLNDVKEKAEHAMLVDLGRNDIGRVSEPGTVMVDQLMQVEKFSHVMHLVSKVSGKLDYKYTPIAALGACFPAGTVSGAPKVRAMELISDLEREYRGAYAGAVGYLDFQGNIDTCITIRTMVIDGTAASIRTGAGIVADSIPENEYQEIRHKAQALFKVLEGDDEIDIADR